MKQMKTVIVETYLRQVKSWSFLAMVFAPFLILGLSGFIGYLSGSSMDQSVGLVATPEVAQVVNSQETFDSYTSQDQANQAVQDQDLSGYVVLSSQNGQYSATYYGSSSLSQTDKAILLQGLQVLQNQANLAQAQVSSDQSAILSRQPVYQEDLADASSTDLKKAMQQLSFIGVNAFIYFLLLTYMSLTAQEIASEKGTKIMEVIFSSIEAKKYFYGRMIGFLGVIITHISIYVLAGAVAYTFLLPMDFAAPYRQMIHMVLGNLNGLIILFSIFALFLFVILSALCGSLVSRAEDANKAVQPVTVLSMALFFGTYAFMNGSDNLILTLLSYVPLSSPFYMPIRLINSNAGTAEALISLVILILTCLGLVLYTGRRYAGFILQKDDRGIWATLLRGLSYR